MNINFCNETSMVGRLAINSSYYYFVFISAILPFECCLYSSACISNASCIYFVYLLSFFLSFIFFFTAHFSAFPQNWGLSVCMHSVSCAPCMQSAERILQFFVALFSYVNIICNSDIVYSRVRRSVSLDGLLLLIQLIVSNDRDQSVSP